MKKLLLMKTVLLLFALVVGSSSVWAATVTKEETFNFSTTGCTGWSTDNAGSYCGGYGRNRAGSYYVANASISNFSSVNFSAVNTPSVTIYVKALTNGGTNTYTVSLVDKDGNVVGTPVTKTNGMGSGSNSASASESSVVLTPVSGTTGYRIDFPAKSAITQTRYILTYDPAPAAPTFSPAAGDFSDDFELTISCATDGATIYYTTNGDTPTSSSTVYNPASKPTITAGADVTVKAIAIKAGASSTVSSATYTYKNIANPVFGPIDGSTVLYGESVAITCATDGAEIYYTQGSTPADPTSASTKYTSPIVLTEGTTIKAIAINGSDESDVVSATYTVKATAPTFSIDEGTYNTNQSVALGCTTAGATIYYTTDGTTPTNESTVYSSAIAVNVSTTINAIAIKTGLTNSDVTSAEYTLKVATPTFSIAGGDFEDAQNIEILCATEGATIHYTTNGATPTKDSPEYTAAVTISDVKTLKAIAIKDGWTNSDMATEEYRVIIPATLPFTFNSGKSNIDTTTGLVQSGLGTDYSSSTAPNTQLKFDDANDYLILKIGEVPGTLTYSIKGNGFSGGTFKVQTSADGSSYSDLAKYTTLGDTKSESFNLTGDIRYIKWIYSSRSSGNVGLGNISLTKTNTITLAEACTDGTKYYSTYSLGKAFVVPEGLTVSTVGLDNEGKLTITDYSTGDIVKANTGVLVSATSFGAKTVTVSAETGTEKDGNLLKPSGDAGITAANMTEADTKFYRLTMHNGSEIGFWWGAADGAAFDLAANKAYLAVPTTNSAREGLWFGDDVTAIETVKTQQADGQYFNLAGQKVQNPTKGLYIVNGKKVIIK